MERIRPDGRVEVPLTSAALEEPAAALDRIDPACVAVCLMNSYLNPQHEQSIAEYLAKTRPGLKVSCSSALSAEIREYERTSTTVLNAVLIPVIAGYLDKLTHRMEAEGFAPRLLLVQSNGGVCAARTAALEPVRLLLSGPSGGSAACALLSKTLGEDNLIGVDMGGTSFDVSVVRNGRVNVVMQGEVDRMPVRIPMVEIRAIGAGGGSLAKVQRGKRLTVGPESAGSYPGPACYGRGGLGATVTDANVTLGRIDGEKFLGGGMRLDCEAARAVIDTEVATPLGLPIEAAAEGLLAVVNANLGAAIRLSLFEKGVDPREFTMIAFGGAAGLHAVAVADETGIRRVVFPENASTLSAYGILHSDLIHDLVRSRVLDGTPENLGAIEPLPRKPRRRRACKADADAIPPSDRHIELAADMHYKGQAFELTVPLRSLQLDEAALSVLIGDFHDLHRQFFSYSNPSSAVEIVSLRASAIGRLPKPAAKTADARTAASRSASERSGFPAVGGMSRWEVATTCFQASRSRGRPSSRKPTPASFSSRDGVVGATRAATSWRGGMNECECGGCRDFADRTRDHLQRLDRRCRRNGCYHLAHKSLDHRAGIARLLDCDLRPRWLERCAGGSHPEPSQFDELLPHRDTGSSHSARQMGA